MAGFTSIDFKSNTMSAAITLAQLRPQLFTANKNNTKIQNIHTTTTTTTSSGSDDNSYDTHNNMADDVNSGSSNSKEER